MSDTIIIGIVVLVALIAHIWIFKWVKFKVDESTIINFIKQHPDEPICSSNEISLSASIKLARVTKVCSESKEITAHNSVDDSWTLR